MTRDQVRASLARRGRAERAPMPPQPKPRRWIGREEALRLAAQAYGVSTIDLISKRRQRDLVEARALFVWTCFGFGLNPGYSSLGRFLGGRDHTTIINLREKAEQLLAEHAEFIACAELIAAIVRSEGNLSHASH